MLLRERRSSLPGWGALNVVIKPSCILSFESTNFVNYIVLLRAFYCLFYVALSQSQ